jgi:hypothetical protein
MSTMTVLDSTGSPQTVEKPLTPGRAAAAASRPVVLSNEDSANLAAIATNASSTAASPVEVVNPNYEAVAASTSAQVMGISGAAGDILSHVVIIPATTSPGAVSIQDGAGSAITIFVGGASSVTTLIPFGVPLGIVAGTNWKITTGANVSAIGVGKFS